MSTDTAGIYSRQLIQDVGLILSVCLKDVVQIQPQDPIDFIARWLYKYIDNKLYYEINSDYHMSVRANIQQDKKRRRVSREHQNYLNFQLQSLKVFEKRVSAGADRRSSSPLSSMQHLDESDVQYTDITGPLRSYTSIDGDILMPLGSFDSYGKTRSTISDRPMMPLIEGKDVSMPAREFVASKPVPMLPSRRGRDDETALRGSFSPKPSHMLAIRESKDELNSPRGSVSSLPDQGMLVPTGRGYVPSNFGQWMPMKKDKQKGSQSSPRGSVAFIHVRSRPAVINKDKAMSHSPRGSASFKKGYGHRTPIKKTKSKTISHPPRGPGTSRHAPVLPIKRSKDKTPPASPGGSSPYKPVIQLQPRQDTLREESGLMMIDDYTISLSSSERTTMTTSVSVPGSGRNSYDTNGKGKGRPSEEFTYWSLPGSANVSLGDVEPQKSQRGSMSEPEDRQRGSTSEPEDRQRGSMSESPDLQRGSMDEAQRSQEPQERQRNSVSDGEEIIGREDRRTKQESPTSSVFWQADSARRSAMGLASLQSHRESIKSAGTEETMTYATSESYTSVDSSASSPLTTTTNESDEEITEEELAQPAKKIYKKDRSLRGSISSSRTSALRRKSQTKFSKAIRVRRKQTDAQDLKTLFMIQQMEEAKKEKKKAQKRLGVSDNVKEVTQTLGFVLSSEELDYDEHGKKEEEAKPEFNPKQTTLWSKSRYQNDDEDQDRFKRWRRAAMAAVNRDYQDQSSDGSKSYQFSKASTDDDNFFEKSEKRGSWKSDKTNTGQTDTGPSGGESSRRNSEQQKKSSSGGRDDEQERKSVDTSQVGIKSLKRSKDAEEVVVEQGTEATNGRHKDTKIDYRHSQETKTLASDPADWGRLDKSKDAKEDKYDQVSDNEDLDSDKKFRSSMDGKYAQNRKSTDGRQTGYYTESQDVHRKSKDREDGRYSRESGRRSRDEHKREFSSIRAEKDARYPGVDVKVSKLEQQGKVRDDLTFKGLDRQRTKDKSSKKATKERKRSAARTQEGMNGEWRYVWTQRAIVFDHPILGELRSSVPRPWPDKQQLDLEDSQCEVLYDPEIYTVCDRRADDEEYAHRMLEWTGTTWVFKEINNA